MNEFIMVFSFYFYRFVFGVRFFFDAIVMGHKKTVDFLSGIKYRLTESQD